MPKRKHTLLTIKQKNELLDKLEKGVPVVNLVAEYGVAKQTVSDIKRNKEKICAYAAQVHSDQGVSDPKYTHKKLKTGQFIELEKAVLEWYRQQESVGIAVRGSDLKDASFRLAVQMKMKDFQASNGWFYRFRQRHGLFQLRAHGESGSAKVDEVGPFRMELNKLINDEGLLMSQVYNFDETALLWHALPMSTQVISRMAQAKGRKLHKIRISMLAGANANGSHRLPHPPRRVWQEC